MFSCRIQLQYIHRTFTHQVFSLTNPWVFKCTAIVMERAHKHKKAGDEQSQK